MLRGTRKFIEKLLEKINDHINEHIEKELGIIRTGTTEFLMNTERNSRNIIGLLQRVHKIETIIGVGDYEYVTKLEKKKEVEKK